MSKHLRHFYEFGPFRVDPAERRLLRDGQRVPLPPKAFETLVALVQRSGHLLLKEELLKTVWPDTFVEENNLTQYVSALRRALRENGADDRPDYIETVPRVGYRFAPGVREVWDEGDDLIVENRTSLRVFFREETQEEEPNGADATARPVSARQSNAPALWRRRRTAAAAFVVLVGLVGALVWKAGERREERARLLPPGATIALPAFRVAGGERDEFLARGLSHDLSARLARLQHFNIRPAGVFNSQQFQGGDEAEAVRQQLGAHAVLDGQVERLGEQLRVTLRLAGPEGTPLLPARQFTADGENIQTLAAEMAGGLGLALVPDLSERERRMITRFDTESAAAYESYLKGINFWNERTNDGLHKSILAFEQAVAHDPGFALAFVGLANAYVFDLIYWTKAETAAQRAIQIEPSLGEAHAVLGFINLFWRWDQRAAEREFKRALELNPYHATTHQWYAVFLAANGRASLAVGEMQRALELDPLSLPINADLAQMLYFTREYDGAIRQARRTLKLNPDFLNAHLYLYQTLTQTGAYAEAIEELITFERLAQHSQPDLIAAEKYRRAYAAGGVRAFWQARIEAVRRPLPSRYLLAQYHALLGDSEVALDFLDQSCDRRDFAFTLFLPDPAFDSLRASPRFRNLERCLNVIGP